MFWHLRSEHPYHMIQKVALLDNTMVETKDGLKSKYELISPTERVAMAKEHQMWDQNAGRYLYTPPPKSSWYILQPHMIKGISAGNRFGKTATHSVEIVAQIEGWHPLQRLNLEKLYKDAIDPEVKAHCGRLLDEKKWIPDPPIEARCVSVDYGFVERVNGPEFIKWASKSEVRYIGFDNEKKRRINWKDGSYVEFMTHAQELDAHGGASRQIIMFDEEAPQSIWTESMLRIADCNGRILYGCTGVEGVTWSDEAIWIPGLAGEDPDIYVIEMSTYDNPTITNAMIDKIKRQCATEDEVQIRIFGKRVRKGGSVYDMARDEYPWIIPTFPESGVLEEERIVNPYYGSWNKPPDKGILILSIDIHPKTEQALLWVWVDTEGDVDMGGGDRSFKLRDKPNLYEVAEIFKNANVKQMDFLIKTIEGKLGRRHDYLLLELAAWNDDQNSASSNVASQFGDLGYAPMKASKDLIGGILKVKNMLTVKDFITGEDHPNPLLMTCENLERLRWERKNYHYPRPPKGQDMPIKQKPVDKDDHLMETERRIVEFVADHEMEIFEYRDENSFIMPDGTVIEIEDEVTFDATLGE